MELDLQPLLEYDLKDTIALLNNGFSGYFVNVHFSPGTFLHMVMQDSIDMHSSRVVVRNGESVGIALIARRGWSSRLAAMAIVPEARGKGVGRWFLPQLLAEARARGEHRMLLEVIEQNTAGVHLYQGSGFQILRRLVGYTSQNLTGVSAELTEVDIRDVAALVTGYGLSDLPWQLSGESMASVAPPHKAFQLDSAFVIISDPTAPVIAIRSIIVQPEGRRSGQATRLLQALAATYPQRQWKAMIICPEEISGLFEKAGFVCEPLAQFQMVADLKR
ncbi:MAG: GNAT family N-acetyltransferase [Chloroflexota bacterium]